ncbi:MAG: S66 peptidase family protein [Clostridia bacterium]|jgi:muramoyltetrapeptide carboxypeptidase
MNNNEIRIVTSSGNLNMNEDDIDYIKAKLKGYDITFGKNVNKSIPEYNCPSIEDRKNDIEEAFLDKNVKAIMIARGGALSNQLLDEIDYEIIQKNPKIIIGFSDATSLLNAIYSQTKLKTYYGPNFSVLAMRKGNDYTYEYLNKVLNNEEEYYINPAISWSSDKWYKDQDNRKFIKNNGMNIINEGNAEGTIIGGNLNTFSLLQGTKYMPIAQKIILFIEEDNWANEDYLYEFDRRLQSLTQQAFFKKVKGIIIGRAQQNVNMNINRWKTLISMNKKLINMPIVVNADFGHTMPMATFPIGGKCIISGKGKSIRIKIINKD